MLRNATSSNAVMPPTTGVFTPYSLNCLKKRNPFVPAKPRKMPSMPFCWNFAFSCSFAPTLPAAANPIRHISTTTWSFVPGGSGLGGTMFLGGVGGSWRILPARASSKPSVTRRLRTFSIVCTRQLKASAILPSDQPGPSASALSRI